MLYRVMYAGSSVFSYISRHQSLGFITKNLLTKNLLNELELLLGEVLSLVDSEEVLGPILQDFNTAGC
ncbi:hypothetical protein kpssk3_011 [Klebsiella phage kpssk3]|uniref:Uncharacterized protein n=1 Tax=Klebsiella phage kpssk3 TaxID=2488949 RepID=A0A3G8F3N5_9CAUD|nr:hypothetical protein HOU69_gp11 [Klebsiella phage kpssk3]AZF88816.1 hypothetical protein kpssk3_011 [Klebsiella phage kpssk3]